jgi:N-acetylmuramic acid 6-phosphate etherase
VRLGKTFENLMVDLRPGSAKLRDRARRILAMATGLGAEDAERLAAAAGGEIKTAIVMARLGLDADAARRRLAAAEGHVWRALESGAGRIAPG